MEGAAAARLSGRLCRPGPASRAVVRLLRYLQGLGAICLRGNHEEMMARSCGGEWEMAQFLANGGDATIASYDDAIDAFVEDRWWLAALPTSYEDDLRIFVHAGLMPHLPPWRSRTTR